MTSIKQEATIVKYRKQKHLNIGIIIFGIIFIYLIATIVLYLTAPRITVYEVRQGSILNDNAYTGLVLREETVVYAENDGYINYYVENNSKIKVGADVYTLSDEKLKFEKTASDEEITLTEEESRSLTYRIQEYNEQFQNPDFSSTYQLKNELNQKLNKITSQSKADQLKAMLSESGRLDLLVKSSEQDGIIVYAIDGMEDVTTENVSSRQLKKSDYHKTEFASNTHIQAGEPVYKIVTSDKWCLLIEISEETREELKDKKTVKINFKKDNQQIRANITFLEGNNASIACLSFHDSMIRYVNERYLDIELILDDESGLKIPKSSETTKDFYVVPKSYLTQGGNSSSDGVMRQTTNSEGNSITEFMAVNVYYEEDDLIYLDPKAFGDKDILIKPDSTETISLTEKRPLQGVYCINKGYAVFKQIQILCESDEYYIIEEGSDFGLSNYDHIALNSSSIKENDVVF